MSSWYFTFVFIVTCAMWFCGSSAAYSQSPIKSIAGFVTAFVAGFMCATNDAVGPLSASLFMVGIFIIGFLVGRGERKRGL